MAGTEDLSRGAGVVVGLGGHKGLLLQRWSGVTCPALHPGAPVSRVWRGEDRLRCCFLVWWSHVGYEATHTHCSAGRSRCKQTRVFRFLLASLVQTVVGPAGDTTEGPLFNCPRSDARLLRRSRCSDFSSANKGCFHSATFHVDVCC